jgi:hypothetical protein
MRFSTIDAIVARSELTRVEPIKLDVEGSEVDALDSAKQSISDFRPTIPLEAEDARLASPGPGRTRQRALGVRHRVGAAAARGGAQ